MKLFERKYDYEKDLLRLGFDPDIKQYSYYFKGTNKISYEDLNRRMKKKLVQENKRLLSNGELLEKLLEKS